MARSSQLQEYLTYYRSLKDPQYAVLVTGDWGTGKTYQVREVLPKDKAFYVSLFGLNRVEDVIAAVYTAMFPIKAKLKKIGESVAETSAEIPGLGSLGISGLTSGLIGALLREKVDKEKPIIFDDLERCGLGAKETLGVINLYVEHHGCRVIVIAHDAKMTDEFTEAKEKIFGQTIQIQPQVTDAFAQFASALSKREKEFVLKHQDNIIGIFKESDAQSLRILRHLIEDLVRLTQVLSSTHRSHDQAMAELVRLFAAFNIEWRSNRLQADDLSQREEVEARYSFARHRDEAVKQPPIVAANGRYSAVNLTSTLLQDHVLKQILVEGKFDKDAIRGSLDASAYFLKPQSAAPWQVVINFDKLDDDIVSTAASKMQEQFDERKVLDTGEMLHIFALRMMMSSNGMTDKRIEAVADECKLYVDDLLRAGKLPPRGLNWRWHQEFERSAYGIGYWVTRDYEALFNDVFRHLVDARIKAFEEEFPARAKELLRILERDGQEFFEHVCVTHSGKSQYAMVPILTAIEPEVFVASWMGSPKENWHWICDALNERYKVPTNSEIKVEAEWIKAVVNLLGREAEKASGFAKVRIKRVIPRLPEHLLGPEDADS
jgi:hypothetical protein